MMPSARLKATNGHEVVDDARGDNDPGHTSVLQSEVIENLEGDDNGRCGHRKADEHGRHNVEAECERGAETDTEGNNGPDDRDSYRLFQGREKLPWRCLDARMKEQEENPEIRENLDDLVRFDPAENGGSQQDPHDELAHDGRQADAAAPTPTTAMSQVKYVRGPGMRKAGVTAAPRNNDVPTFRTWRDRNSVTLPIPPSSRSRVDQCRSGVLRVLCARR